jgi:anti-anti-sigma factor
MSVVPDPLRFKITSTIDGQSTVLALHGRFENEESPELNTLLDAAIDRRADSVVLDLSALAFLGTAGLVAIANSEKRLSELGVQLTVRSPSVLLDHLLELSAIVEDPRHDRTLAAQDRLGPEEMSALSELLPSHAPEPTESNIRRVIALPTEPDVVDGALRLVVELAKLCVSGADGVSISLLRHGVLSTVAASDDTIMAMDADQYATGEGPCVDASLKGHWFHAESLDTETRWPSFTPRAIGLGIKAIMSSPLKAFERPVGALNIYSRTAEPFEIKDQEKAATFAQKASTILSDAGAGVSEEQVALRYQQALRSRESIAMAKGVAMERYGFDEDGAFNALLRLSLYRGETLRTLADSIVLTARKAGRTPSV